MGEFGENCIYLHKNARCAHDKTGMGYDDCEGVCSENCCPMGGPVLNITIVQVTFAGNNEVRYDFFTDLDLKVGEDVVCHTVRGFGIGKVVGHVDTSTKARDWIVQRVDVKKYKALVERERQAKEIDDMLG